MSSLNSTKKNIDVAIAEKEKIREPSKYNVIVHNNDITSFEEVMIILCQAFDMSHDKAMAITGNVHSEGRGVCGTYSKEVAEMKLVLVSSIKDTLVQMIPSRSREIKMLLFTVEKV
jgi:ATP-dependent Clp protease adaptor protein ClpS